MPKQYLPLAGRAVLAHALSTLLEHPRIEGAVVVLHAEDRYWAGARPQTAKPLLTATGGAERAASVAAGLAALATRLDDDDWVLVHDAARPCVTRADLDALFAALQDAAVGGLLASPVRDTLKRDDGRGGVAQTVDRSGLWHALTPQMFRFGVLRDALSGGSGAAITDEASAVEAAGRGPVVLVEGRADNIKVTRPGDLALAAQILLAQSGETGI